jgi:2-amino-4-hydroxy-6-hydroxymethyldihydropteridine diphosphokinase
VEALAPEVRTIERSSIWETAPIGPDQPDYLNAVVVADTVLGPRPLLERCLAVERELGRERRERWGPRVIDIDLLLYSDAVLDAPGLTVPHPRMHERRFVLAPLAEVWPDAEIPDRGDVGRLLRGVQDQDATRTDFAW